MMERKFLTLGTLTEGCAAGGKQKNKDHSIAKPYERNYQNDQDQQQAEGLLCNTCRAVDMKCVFTWR